MPFSLILMTKVRLAFYLLFSTVADIVGFLGGFFRSIIELFFYTMNVDLS